MIIKENIISKFCAVFAIYLICFSSCSSKKLVNGQRLLNNSFTAASYNIRFAGEQDVKSGNGWNVRKKSLSEVILNHQMDIIGTQEGSKQQLADLKSLLGGYEFKANPYGGNSGTIHNAAIFYKPDLFDVLTSGVFWLSKTPDEPSLGWDASDRRICQWVKFKYKPSGKEFYYFNAHFYWRGNTAKKESGPLIVSKIKSIAGDSPVLLGGDLNCGSESSQINAIKSLMIDSYESAEKKHSGIEETAFPGGTFQGKPKARIDYLFTSSHFSVLNYKVGTDVYKDVNNKDTYPSDHLPVICVLTLN